MSIFFRYFSLLDCLEGPSCRPHRFAFFVRTEGTRGTTVPGSAIKTARLKKAAAQSHTRRALILFVLRAFVSRRRPVRIRRNTTTYQIPKRTSSMPHGLALTSPTPHTVAQRRSLLRWTPLWNGGMRRSKILRLPMRHIRMEQLSCPGSGVYCNQLRALLPKLRLFSLNLACGGTVCLLQRQRLRHHEPTPRVVSEPTVRRTHEGMAG